MSKQRLEPQFATKRGKVFLQIPAGCTMHQMWKLENEIERMAERGDVRARRWLAERIAAGIGRARNRHYEFR